VREEFAILSDRHIERCADSEGKYKTTPTKIPSGGQSKRLQGHFVAQAFQPPDQGSADSVHVDPIKVIRTEFPVVVSNFIKQQMGRISFLNPPQHC
jgi:hypothetical protein